MHTLSKNILMRSVWVGLIALVALIAAWFRISTLPTAVAAPATETAPAVAATGVEKQLQQLGAKINAKLAAGAHTEEGLAEELKAFDVLLAEHKNEQTEEVASVLMMKASLYVDVLQAFEKGATVLKQVKTDFPNTQAAKKIDEFLTQLAPQIEMEKIQSALKPGIVLPDFNVKDLAGEPLSIAKYKGKVVLVDFWATWCGPCVGELPNVIAAYQKYHAKGFEVIGISLDRDVAALKTFITEKGMPWPQHLDKEGDLLSKYGFIGIPSTFLLDGEGKIIAKNLRGEELGVELEKKFGK